MATIKRFEDLEIWQLARKFSLDIFKITNIEPFSRDFKFRDQIRSAAGSAMDNIAEGFERSSRLEFINFLSISKGSAGEIKSQLYRVLDQEYISQPIFDEIYANYDRLAAGIGGFITYLNNSEIKGQKFKDRK
jgi:four helix bundle protein